MFVQTFTHSSAVLADEVYYFEEELPVTKVRGGANRTHLNSVTSTDINCCGLHIIISLHLL